MKKISRRDFLKGSLAGAAALSVTGLGLGKTQALADDAAAEAPKHSWEIKPDPIDPSEIVKTVDTEILVIGGGYSGCATAARALSLVWNAPSNRHGCSLPLASV